MLDPPVLAAHVLARVRPALPDPLAADRHPGRADRAHGKRVLHDGAHVGEIPRRLLSVSAEKVRGERERRERERGSLFGFS